MRTPKAPRPQQGIVLVILLIAMLFASVLALAGAEAWATTRAREREAELLWVGDQYRQAIRHYYYATPSGQTRTLPAQLADLVDDNRYPTPVHHLRRLYPDPLTGSTEWGLLQSGDRIAGVYSLSEAKPIKQTGFEVADASFEARDSYKDWVFSFVLPASLRRR